MKEGFQPNKGALDTKNPPKGGSGVPVKRELHNVELQSVSFVDACPYCGTKDWNTSFKKEDGTICNHPTKFKKIKND